jgi:hypothetical protein
MRDAMPSRLCIHPRRRDPQQRGDLLRGEELAARWRLLLAGLVHRRVVDPEQPQAANELLLLTRRAMPALVKPACQSRQNPRPARAECCVDQRGGLGVADAHAGRAPDRPG